MENGSERQPLDVLMEQFKLTNADLVKASTEQLSFKMVNKGRNGRRLTPNIQDKILRALLKVKPDLKLSRRHLFRYEIAETVLEQIENAMSRVRNKEIGYPQFIELLAQAGITRYTAEVPNNRIIFYGVAGEAHIKQGPAVSQEAPGQFNEDAIRSAIADAQQGTIDHSDFLKRIYEAGISVYEVNIRDLKIVYNGEGQSYREKIPSPGAVVEKAVSKPPQKKMRKPSKKNKKHRRKMTTKARMDLNRRRFTKRRPKKN